MKLLTTCLSLCATIAIAATQSPGPALTPSSSLTALGEVTLPAVTPRALKAAATPIPGGCGITITEEVTIEIHETITCTETVISTQTVSNATTVTVSLPGSVVTTTLPGLNVTGHVSTVVSTVAGPTVTIGPSTVTSTVKGPTVTLSGSTVTLRGSTIAGPGKTITLTGNHGLKLYCISSDKHNLQHVQGVNLNPAWSVHHNDKLKPHCQVVYDYAFSLGDKNYIFNNSIRENSHNHCHLDNCGSRIDSDYNYHWSFIYDHTRITTDAASISVCSTLTINPTYSPPAALPRNYTWGCPPGFLCKPSRTGERQDCTIEAGLPAENYTCSPSECVIAPPLVHQRTTDGNQTYTYSEDYYNLDPENFGLNYHFKVEQSSQTPQASVSSTGRYTFIPPAQWGPKPIAGGGSGGLGGSGGSGASGSTGGTGGASENIPPLCYNPCNDAALEPQSIGKVPELCKTGSAFSVDLANCQSCISHWASTPSDVYSKTLLPSFSQWLNFCDDMTITSVSSTVPPTVAITTSEKVPTTNVAATSESTPAAPVSTSPAPVSAPQVTSAVATTSSQATSAMPVGTKPAETKANSVTQAKGGHDMTTHVPEAYTSAISFPSSSTGAPALVPPQPGSSPLAIDVNSNMPSKGSSILSESNAHTETSAGGAGQSLTPDPSAIGSPPGTVFSKGKDPTSGTGISHSTTGRTHVGSSVDSTDAGNQTIATPTTNSVGVTDSGASSRGSVNQTQVAKTSSTFDSSMSRESWSRTTSTIIGVSSNITTASPSTSGVASATGTAVSSHIPNLASAKGEAIGTTVLSLILTVLVSFL
ncbi:hypothetical protein N7539_008275 [Penicillium diatomitis]|uniref:Uncharacterized protein n=1 Tax=Penicillium diatomitis TaxID=2819901 RepID=A0A9W9WTH9_9EURO|nr:uncharacterized protein N7539_008275 [Penicillium diatomitis]KAJ5475209.1 hypothetical protein N7539_008275 [Penicillium diatomitis]